MKIEINDEGSTPLGTKGLYISFPEDATLYDETVWLTQKAMQELFDRSKSTVSEHISNVFKEGELEENQVVRKFRTSADDRKEYEVS